MIFLITGGEACALTVLHYTSPYFTVLHCTSPYFTILHCTSRLHDFLDHRWGPGWGLCHRPYFTILHCTSLYFTATVLLDKFPSFYIALHIPLGLPCGAL